MGDDDGWPCGASTRSPGVAAGMVRIVASGAINSPQILLKSGIANSSGQVGRNLHLHPSVLLAGIYDEDINGYTGIPQSYYVDEFIDLEKDPNSGYILMPGNRKCLNIHGVNTVVQGCDKDILSIGCGLGPQTAAQLNDLDGLFLRLAVV